MSASSFNAHWTLCRNQRAYIASGEQLSRAVQRQRLLGHLAANPFAFCAALRKNHAGSGSAAGKLTLAAKCVCATGTPGHQDYGVVAARGVQAARSQPYRCCPARTVTTARSSTAFCMLPVAELPLQLATPGHRDYGVEAWGLHAAPSQP